MDNSDHEVYKLATLLVQKYVSLLNTQSKDFHLYCIVIFSKNMSNVYKMRASILYNKFKKTKFDLVVSRMISSVLHSIPSYTEFKICDNQKCDAYDDSRETYFEVLSMSNVAFDNNFTNLETAILLNLPELIHCTSCDNPMDLNHTFGDHLFIDVIITILNNISKFSD